MAPPEHADEAVAAVLATYAEAYPLARDVRPEVRWWLAQELPACGWHRGCTDGAIVDVVATKPLSEGPLAHELEHWLFRVYGVDRIDKLWTDEERAAVDAANARLRRMGL